MGTKAFKGVKMTGEQQDLPYPAAARYNEKRRLRVRGGDALKCGNKSLPEMNLRGRLFFQEKPPTPRTLSNIQHGHNFFIHWVSEEN